MPGLSLWLFGPPRLELEGRPIKLARRKSLALLAYLAVTGEAQLRESLAALFYPEFDQSRAHSALRRDLSELNTGLGHSWLVGDRDSVRLRRRADPGTGSALGFWLDLNHFHDLLAECQNHDHPPAAVCPACLPLLGEAAGLCRGEFLAGFTLRDSTQFDEWQFFQAESLRQEMASTLERLVHGHSTFGEDGRQLAIPYARQWLALDPLHEPAHRHLMQLYAGTGRHAAALRQYAECVRILEQELGVPPSTETTQLYEAIKAHRLPSRLSTSGEQPPVPGSSPAGDAISRPPAQVPISTFPDETVEAERSTFVGLESELAQLEGFLKLALAGQGQVVFVVGEAGSGKTAMVQEFARRALTKHADLLVAGGNCNAYTGLGDPYLPFREILGRLTGDLEASWLAGATGRMGGRRCQAFAPQAIRALTEIGPDLVDTFVPGPALVARAVPVSGTAEWLARLRDLIERHAASQSSGNVKQTDLFEQYARVIQSLAGQQPSLLVLDDLHWADAGSINLLFHLGRRLRASRVLITGIYRPAEVALGRTSLAQRTETGLVVAERERHPLESLVNEFQLQFGDITVDLNRAADRQFVDAYLDAQPNLLGQGFREALFRQTGGHALFTVEMFRGMQDRGDIIKDNDGRWIEGPTLNWEILPARIEGVIGERIGRLPAPLREMLKVASVEGEVFTAEVVARVQLTDDRLMVRYLSGELDQQYRLIRNQSSRKLGPDGQQISQYRFRHILFQRYLYSSLDDAECTYLHESVGQVLERLYGEQMDEIAVQLARHFEAAGWPAKAVHYLQRAGEKAVRLSANEEALVHFTRALKLLERLPPTPERLRQELTLQIALFTPLSAVKGYGTPEVGEAYTRARELCLQINEPPLLFQVLYGLWGYNLVHMNLNMARELAQECLALADTSHAPALLLESNRMAGETAYHRGEVARAREYLERSRALYDSPRHHIHAALYGQDPGVALLSHGSWALWHLGYPDQALAWSQEALALAQEVAHPFSQVFALDYASILHQQRGERQASLERSNEAIAISVEQRFTMWLAKARISRGWALVQNGEIGAGIVQMRENLAAYRATGSELFVTHYLILLARAYASSGDLAAAHAAVDEGLAIVEATEGRLWEAELYRLQGELLLQGDDPEEKRTAEAHFLKALEIARRQEARSLELRAAMSLGRLWDLHGKRAEARALLADTYNWFTEGFETAGLRDARHLLKTLSLG